MNIKLILIYDGLIDLNFIKSYLNTFFLQTYIAKNLLLSNKHIYIYLYRISIVNIISGLARFRGSREKIIFCNILLWSILKQNMKISHNTWHKFLPSLNSQKRIRILNRSRISACNIFFTFTLTKFEDKYSR